MIRLAVRCRPAQAELALAELVALAPGGVEEERGSGYVEFAIYGAPGELPALPDLRAAVGEGLVEVSSTEVPDDWADRWRDFHEPSLVAGRFWIRPGWAEPLDGAIDLVIDPGQAFGTGAHSTTRMSLELLSDQVAASGSRGSLADLGTGSGVLAIAAAKLGFAPVLACDHEPAALNAARENAAANGVRVELQRLNLREDPPPPADVVLANLTAPLLEAVAAQLSGPPRALVCSGLLVGESERVGAALAAAGLRVTERRADGDWVALGAERAGAAGRVRP